MLIDQAMRWKAFDVFAAGSALIGALFPKWPFLICRRRSRRPMLMRRWAEIECQRELIVELMHLGQPTEAAEQALNSLLGQFASMIEHEHGILAEALEPKE